MAIDRLPCRRRLPGGLCAAVLLIVSAGCNRTQPPAASSPSPISSPTAAPATASPSASPSVSAVAVAPRIVRSWTAPPIGKSVIRVPHPIPNPPRDFLRAPKGFKIQLVADGLDHPRWLAVAPNNDIFVVESRLEIRQKDQPNRITVLRDADGDGVAEVRSRCADGLDLPFGIAIHGGYLYVANTGSIVRWPYRDGDLAALAGAPEVVIRGIPERGFRQHWTRNILFSDREQRLYVTIGSKENADIEEPLRGTIVSYALDSTGKPFGEPRIVASGMRNPVGLALYPLTGNLWTVVNERDYLGDPLVPDFLTEIREGDFYGWPYYFVGGHHDPRLPERPDLKAKIVLPDVLLGSHGAPLGLVFTPSGRSALIARHGSQNSSRMVGYDIVRVSFDALGRPRAGFSRLITGWLAHPDEAGVYGRPAGLAWANDGSLLIADDWGGRIWRVTATGPKGFDE